MKSNSEFRLRPLGELCEVTGGSSAPQGEEFFRGGTIPFVRMRDLGAYHHTTQLDTTRDAVTLEAVEKKRLKIFEPGCILFPRSGSVQLNHRAILAIRASIVSHIGILQQFAEDIDVRYLYWFLVRYDMGEIAKQTTGLDLVNFSDVKKISVPVPATVKEQRRIVAEIEKQFTRLEAGVAALRRVKANLKRYRAAVLKAACEGQLVPTEAALARSLRSTKNGPPAYETGEALLARILTERRQTWQGRGQHKEPSVIDAANLPPLPDGWAWASMRQVGEVQLGRQRAPQHHTGDNMRPYLRVANVFEARIDTSDVKEMNFTPVEFERYRLRHGDILLNEGQTPELVGRPAMFRDEIADCCYQKTLLRFRAYDGVLPAYALTVFRAYMHNQRFTRAASITTNIAHLTAEKFVEIEFPLPPLAEQTRIVAEVERRLSVVEELESVVSANLQRATRLRQSILQKAFTGEL